MITKIMAGDHSPSLNRLDNLLKSFADGRITIDQVWELMHLYYITTVPAKEPPTAFPKINTRSTQEC